MNERGLVELPEWMIPELDFAILEELPVEGTMAGGLVPLGRSVHGLVQGRFGEVGLDSSALSGRMKRLVQAGLARSIRTILPRGEYGKSHSHDRAYQITQSGLELLQTWQNARAQQQLHALRLVEGTREEAVNDGGS